MADLAPCAITCLSEAIANSTCAPLDTSCQCSNKALNLQVNSCISATCTVRETLSALNITSTQCGISPVVDHSFLAPISVLLGIASIAVLLRLASRFKNKTKLWWDDLCNFLALLTGAALFGTVIAATHMGFGTDIWAVPPDNITTFFKIALSDFQIYGICRILIRCSIILFYIRIFSLTGASKPLWVVFAVNLVIWITWLFISIFQCKPVSYFWTQWDGEHQGQCFSANFVAWSGGGVDLAQDLVLLGLPFSYLRHLRLELKKKIATFIMFAVGSLTIALSIVRLTTIPKFTVSVNSTFDAVPIFLWSALELYVGIICACLPSIYPLARPIFSWIIDSFSRKDATSPSYPTYPSEGIDSQRKRHTQREKNKYRPNWDVTLSTMSTTLGDEETNAAPYAQLSNAELGSQNSKTVIIASHDQGSRDERSIL